MLTFPYPLRVGRRTEAGKSVVVIGFMYTDWFVADPRRDAIKRTQPVDPMAKYGLDPTHVEFLDELNTNLRVATARATEAGCRAIGQLCGLYTGGQGTLPRDQIKDQGIAETLAQHLVRELTERSKNVPQPLGVPTGAGKEIANTLADYLVVEGTLQQQGPPDATRPRDNL